MSSLSSASSDFTRSVLNLPNTYADMVAHNSSSVSTVESSLRSLTYLLPGARLHDSELASESVHTFVQLLSIYHDRLLKKRAALIAASPALLKARNLKIQQPKPSLHAKYTTFWSNSSSLYTNIATFLKIAEYTQLLWEMVAKRRGGEKTRWRVVVLIEAFKATCRLVLMRLTNSRPLVSPPMPQREDFAPVDNDSDQQEEFSEEELKMADEMESFNAREALGEAGVPTPPISESDKIPIATSPQPFSMPRTGMTLPTLPTPETVSSYLLSHVLTSDDVRPAKQLLHRLTTIQGQAAEVIYILRPVIYALLMQRLARTYGYEGTKWKNSWTPWLIGVSFEYFSRQLAKRDLSNRIPGSAIGGLSALEKEELKKRGWNLAWWGMRGAFYENVTKRYVTGFADKLKGKPLLDLVGIVVEDYDYLWSNYYFSTSTM
jgi:peroxin-16